MWDTLILNPLVNILIWLYGLMGNNIILAILVLTVLINLLVLPLTMQQQKSMTATQELAPLVEELKKKYKDQPEKLQQEQMALYREKGINPLGGCLPTLIQFPILIGLYQAITQSLAASPIQLLNLSKHIYNPVPTFLTWLPNAPALIPLNSRFLWLDLAAPDPYYILPVLVVITTFLTNKMMTPASSDPNQAAMGRSMQLTMPLFIGYISLTFPAGLSIYWVVSNLVRFGQSLLSGRASLKNLFGTPDGSFSLTGLLGMNNPPTTEQDKKNSKFEDRRTPPKKSSNGKKTEDKAANKKK
jgi:YidC/Oxa1 family membrane protein insertase